MNSNSDSKVAAGTVLEGKYRLEKQLGAGGMGQVFRAEHETIERTVAIKVLHKDLAADDSVRQRFEREAKAIARLKHRNCVMLYEFGFSEDIEALFAVFEYVEGESLEHWIGRQLPIADVIEIGAQVAAGMEHAHEQSIVHRDLKPENIMVVSSDDEGSDVKVLDFGIARIVGDDDRGTRLTQAGQMFGTPPYMSPEQVRAQLDVTHAADIYAIGVMMYELTEGSLPFLGDSPISTAMSHLEDDPPPMEREGRPSELEDVIMKCLEKEPEDRFDSCEALEEALRDIDWERRESTVLTEEDAASPPLAESQAQPDSPALQPTEAPREDGDAREDEGHLDETDEEVIEVPPGPEPESTDDEGPSASTDRADETDPEAGRQQPEPEGEGEGTDQTDPEIPEESEGSESEDDSIRVSADGRHSAPTLRQVDESDQQDDGPDRTRLIGAVASIALLLVLGLGTTLVVVDFGEPAATPTDEAGSAGESSQTDDSMDSTASGPEAVESFDPAGSEQPDDELEVAEESTDEDDPGREAEDEADEEEADAEDAQDEDVQREVEREPVRDPTETGGVDDEPGEPDPIELQRRRRADDENEDEDEEIEQPEGIQLPDRD